MNHRLLDAAHQLACPHDVARNGWGVAGDWCGSFLFVVQLLDSFQVNAVVVEDHQVLGVEVRLK